MTDQPKHVFISYVRENQGQVDRLCEDLKANGVNVWLDRNDITPGIFWEDAIRKAIRDGTFFISCFSEEYNERTTTHMNEELNLAIEVLRKRPREQAWFIPLVLSGDVPDWEIFPGKTLKSIQWVPLYEDWSAGIKRILSVIKPISPDIQILLSALRSKDEDVRSNAASALGKIDHPVAAPALIETLKDEETHVRTMAAWALANIDPEDKAVVPALIEALKDKDKIVREAAAGALCVIGPEALSEIGPEAKAAVPTLIEALKDEEKDVRSYAAKALSEIGPDATASVPALIEALKDENESEVVRWWVANALKQINTPEAQKALEEYNKLSNRLKMRMKMFVADWLSWPW